MIALLLLHTALATGVRFEEVPCPLGGAPARRFHKVSANKLGGYDSDLASYSTKGQFRTHAISTCPDSLYSVYGEHIGRPVSEEERPAVEAALATVRRGLENPDDPPVWERYVLAAHVYQALGRDPIDVARVYLEASWTARDAAVGVYVGGLDGPTAAKKILTAGDAELAKPLTEANRKTVLYSLARVAHRAGENTRRDSYLQRFKALGPTAPERQAMALFLLHAREVEPAMQNMAISLLREGLERTDREPLQIAEATYLLADLLRRRDQPEEALRHYKAVVAMGSVRPQIRDMAHFFVGELDR